MSLTAEVRSACAQIAAGARWVRIDLEALGSVGPGPGPGLDPESHYLEGEPEDVAMYLLSLDAINFGSGWFPELRKRPGFSGYFTVAGSLADRFRRQGAWTPHELRAITTVQVAETLGQSPQLELLSLYAQSLRALGAALGDRGALDFVAESGGSAQRLASLLASAMPMFNDMGFYKRAQIAAHDLALAGVATFTDLDELTIFADNVVPHVLRCDGVLVYEESLAAWIDSELVLPMCQPEREIRGCAVHACELIAQRSGVPPRVLDGWLWNRGQAPEYRRRPRHRTKTVFY